jgi:hypothetical protein
MIGFAGPQFPNNPGTRTDRQVLNPVDRAMRCADRIARELSYPGIATQMLAWLDDRVSAAPLQQAIWRLTRRYPILAARLVEPTTGTVAQPFWQFRPGETCRLREAFLQSDAPAAVLQHASHLGSSAPDPAMGDPIQFHLIHRPGGRDVLLLQYNHVLMDNRMAVPLLQELNRCCNADHGEDVVAEHHEPKNTIVHHLRQFSRTRRHAAVRAAIQLQGHSLRGRAATLVPDDRSPAGSAELQILSRTLGPAATADVRARAIALCGFPNLSMTILASAFRAVDRFGCATSDSRDFVAAIGIPMNAANRRTLVFQNLTSVLPIGLRHQEVHDRDQAVRLLSAQLHQRLLAGIDLGALETLAIFARRFRYVDWAVWHLMQYGHSLWYGHFGNLDAAGTTLCGRRIEQLYFAGGPLWSAIGWSLLVNEFRGCLYFQVTFDRRVVPESLAASLLDFILSDLARRDGASPADIPLDNMRTL